MAEEGFLLLFSLERIMWVGVLGVSYSLTEGILFFFLIIGIVVSQKMSISVFQALR